MNDATDGGPFAGPTTRRQVLKTGAVTSAGLGAVGLLAACGGDDSDGDTAPQRVEKGGTLRIGVDGGGDPKATLDAHTPQLVPAIAAAYNIYEPLARPDADNKLEMRIAESIEPKTASEWVIKLRPDVEFHNGKTVDADDVIFSLKRIIDPKEVLSGGAGTVGGVIDPSKLKKLDAQTIEVGLKQPSALFPSVVGEYFDGIVPVGYDPEEPIGTGPFKAGAFTPGERTVLERFENYHGQAAHLDSVVMTEITDAGARLNALLAGQVDAATAIPAAQVESVQSNQGMKVINVESGNWFPFLMHMQEEPFSDLKLRQAMRLIVDRPAMIEQALSGHGALGNDLWGRFDPAYASDIPQRVQDIEQAKSLLKQAGQSDFRVELVASDYTPGMIEAAQVLVEQAKAAGVTIRLNKLDINDWFAGYTTWPFTITFWGTRDYLLQASQTQMEGAVYPETGFTDAEWTRIVLEAQGELDETKRKDLLHQAQVIDHERGTNIVWGFQNIIDAHSDKVGGIVPGKAPAFGFGNFGFDTMGFVA